MGVSGPRSSPSGTGSRVSSALFDVVPRDQVGSETKERCFLHEVAHILSALPRSIRPQATPTSAHLCDAKERPCSCRRHGRRGGPAHLAKGRRGAPFRPRSPQSFSEDSAPHSVYVQTDLDRVERLDVASPDQGDDRASVEIGRSRPHRHTPPSEDRWRSGTVPTSWLSCVRMRPSERGWSSRTEGHRGCRRSGWPGRSRSFGGSLP